MKDYFNDDEIEVKETVAATIYYLFKDTPLFTYGGEMTINQVCEILDIEQIETGTREEFQEIDLKLLGFQSAMNAALLNEGKYMQKTRTVFRTLTPAENEGKAQSWRNRSTKFSKRAFTLMERTPNVKIIVNNLDFITDMKVQKESKLAKILATPRKRK